MKTDKTRKTAPKVGHTQKVYVTFSKKEAKNIRQHAKKCGLSVSSLVRFASLQASC